MNFIRVRIDFNDGLDVNVEIAAKRNNSAKKDKVKSSFDFFADDDKKDSGGSGGAEADDDDSDVFGFAMFDQAGTSEPTQAEEPPYALPL